MGYRDEFIRRLQESSEWDRSTTEQRHLIESMDDQLAGAFLAWSDEAEVNFQGIVDAILKSDTPEAQSAAVDLLKQGVVNLREVFDGKLINWDTESGVNLTPLGQTLADFFRIAKKEGIPLFNAVSALGNINRGCAMCVAKLGERDSGDAVNP